MGIGAAIAPAAITAGAGLIGGALGGGSSSAQKFANSLITSNFEDFRMQRFLPVPMRSETTNPILEQGISQLGNLIANPGQLSPTVLSAILPRLAMASEGVARDFRGIRANQAGAAARGNLPVSIKAALDSALDVSQNRAQRDVRREALSESEALKRADIEQVYSLLDALLQYTSAGRSQAIGAATATAGLSQNKKASELAFLGSLAGTIADNWPDKEKD